MGRAIEKMGFVPDAIVASPAARAKETAEVAAKAMHFAGSIRLERALYNAPGDVWVEALRAVPERASSVLVVAHSPGIAEAAALLCDASSGSFEIPTGGLLGLVDDVDRWRDLGYGGAALRWFLRPKLIELL
jgi:phosphohistidine phosphatase